MRSNLAFFLFSKDFNVKSKKYCWIDNLISPGIDKPAEYFPPDTPSMQTMMKKTSGEPLYFQAEVTYLDNITDDIDLKDWNFMLGKLELRIIEIANNMGIEFENFTDFVISSGLKLDSANAQDLYTLASMCSLSLETQQSVLEAKSSIEIVEILQKEI